MPSLNYFVFLCWFFFSAVLPRIVSFSPEKIMLQFYTHIIDEQYFLGSKENRDLGQFRHSQADTALISKPKFFFFWKEGRNYLQTLFIVRRKKKGLDSSHQS